MRAQYERYSRPSLKELAVAIMAEHCLFIMGSGINELDVRILMAKYKFV